MVVILHGHQSLNGMYMISLNEQINQPVLQQKHTSNIKAATNNLYSMNSKREIVAYYQKCLLLPEISTWIEAIKQYFFVKW